MKNKQKNLIFTLLLAVILSIACLSICLNNQTASVSASAQESRSVSSGYECEHTTAVGSGGCIVGTGEESAVMPANASTTESKSCNTISTSHGSGREEGYSSSFLTTGCGNYKGYDYCYGVKDVPYYIETENMSSTLAERIRSQAAMWNQVIMHDGTGQIVNFYEVNTTENINGWPVIIVRQGENDEKAVGKFDKDTRTITISEAEMNIDTPLHEFGHVLGLADLDSDDNKGTHKVLMGYDRGTAAATLEQAIKYQDIQGSAVMNGRHLTHSYDRYVLSGGFYIHFCFYCDLVNMSLTRVSGSAAMVTASSCTHNYKLMVSAGNRYWLKCTMCYKVIETDNPDLAVYFGGGNGTTANPFLVGTEAQFRNMEQATADVYVSGQGYVKQISYAFKLTNNITLTGDWSPFSYTFSGNLDGNGKYVTYSSTLTQADLSSNFHGLFGQISGSGKVQNLELRNCSVTNDTDSALSASNGENVSIGILAGAINYAGGLYSVTVTSPTINVNVSKALVGGIAGSLYSTTVSNCQVTGADITSYDGAMGGMAGYGTINSFSGGKVTGTLTKKNYSDDDQMGYVVGNSTSTSTVDVSGLSLVQDKNCIAAGTLITLANGTQVPVEELTGDEMLLVWNLQTGQFDSAPILFIDRDPECTYRVINLSFSDGTAVKVIYEHGFWDYDLNQYVYLNKDAAQYIGHWFNKQAEDENGNMISARVQLTGVEVKEERTASYSPVTYGHLCYYVNGMLSMPGGIGGLFNIFAVDGDAMRYDAAAMQEDIAQYGLYTYEEFSALVPITEDAFEAFNGQYLKVAVGKGLTDIPTLRALASHYADYMA